ncbi:hypothetical protein EYR40_005998 [Pleurotus pulmonarius]|nr:hypothetical protein EYR40_005998 [Pleurotus pulmonarius]
MYFYLITQFGTTDGPSIGVWSLCSMSMLETLIAAPVEFFYAARIWKLGRQVRFGRHIAALIVTLIIAHASLCFLFSAKLMQNPEMATWQGVFYDQIVISGLVLSTIADLLISATMIYIMRSFNTTISSSKALVNSIIRRSIESGTITSIGVIAVMVTFVTMPTNMISFALLFLLPKLYSNSMLAMLNRRQSSSGVSVNCAFDHQHPSRDMIESIHFADSEKVAAISGSESVSPHLSVSEVVLIIMYFRRYIILTIHEYDSASLQHLAIYYLNVVQAERMPVALYNDQHRSYAQISFSGGGEDPRGADTHEFPRPDYLFICIEPKEDDHNVIHLHILQSSIIVTFESGKKEGIPANQRLPAQKSN